MDVSTDAKAVASLQAFANGIMNDPSRYQLSTVDAATIASSVSAEPCPTACHTKSPRKPKEKIDPKHVAARELRDRYLEQVNERPYLLSQGKYDVARVISDRQLTAGPMQLLPAALLKYDRLL